MQLTIVENNARRNGEIIINGWTLDSSDIVINGSEKQVAWARDILRDTLSAAVQKTGIAQGLLSEVGTTEERWAKFQPQVDGFLAQVAAIINGVDAKLIIDNRHRIEFIIAAAKKAH